MLEIAVAIGGNVGKLAGIARRDRKRAPMQILDRAEISTETGVARDFRGRPGQRQVTLLATNAWREACEDLGAHIPWTTRRANLLVEGVDLRSTVGAVLRIGAVRLLVTGEVDPCSRMDEQYPGLAKALQPHWRGGVSCAVVSGGQVAIGDSVVLEAAEA
ncbi:MAG: MOSC domain-containing protein [Woeseia sp.]